MGLTLIRVTSKFRGTAFQVDRFDHPDHRAHHDPVSEQTEFIGALGSIKLLFRQQMGLSEIQHRLQRGRAGLARHRGWRRRMLCEVRQNQPDEGRVLDTGDDPHFPAAARKV